MDDGSRDITHGLLGEHEGLSGVCVAVCHEHISIVRSPISKQHLTPHRLPMNRCLISTFIFLTGFILTFLLFGIDIVVLIQKQSMLILPL
jgi:hypothetical protein